MMRVFVTVIVALMGFFASWHKVSERTPPTCVEARFNDLSLVSATRLDGILPLIPLLPLKSSAVSDVSPPSEEGI